MDKISYLVDGREIRDGGIVKVSVRLININKHELKTNELPIILNALKQSDVLDPDANLCFTYTFPFPLARGHGFPYVFDFDLEDDGLLTLM